MAYVNFKEERYKAGIQLEKRKRNNKKVIENITAHKGKLINKYDEKYSFRKIEQEVINNLKSLREEEFLEIANKTIVAAQFIGCKFYNIKFKQCNFYGCLFENCDFGGGGVVFENCSFVKVQTEKTPSLNVKDNLSCEFKNCNMYVKFSSSDISYLIIEDSLMKNSSFELSDMSYIFINNCEINKVEMSDVNISSAKIVSTYIVDLEFTDKMMSKIDEKTFFDKIPLRINTRDEYEGIYKVYETIADKYEENRLKNNFGEYYYLCKNIERKCLDPFPKICSYINWFASGYGERTFAPLLSSIMLIIIFAVLYYLIGMDIEGEVVKLTLDTFKNFNMKEIIFNFDKALNISTGMFVGAGIIKVDPVAGAYFLTDLEMIIGVIMTGVGIGTLIRKLVR